MNLWRGLLFENKHWVFFVALINACILVLMGSGRGKQRRILSQVQAWQPLTIQEREYVAHVLSEWAQYHPRVDDPVVGFPGKPDMSARDMAEAVSEPVSERGETLFRVFAKGLIPDPGEPQETLESILSAHVEETNVWKAAAEKEVLQKAASERLAKEELEPLERATF